MIILTVVWGIGRYFLGLRGCYRDGVFLFLFHIVRVCLIVGGGIMYRFVAIA